MMSAQARYRNPLGTNVARTAPETTLNTLEKCLLPKVGSDAMSPAVQR